jgi:hypothetical protein
VKAYNEVPSHQERLSAIIVELKANRDTVERMTTRYTLFRFTGGGVSSEQLRCGEISSYLKSPCGNGETSSQDLER